MIRRSEDEDFEAILATINDGAQAYRGTIPADRWCEPYMSAEKLRREIADGVVFWVYAEGDLVSGVMGIQRVHDVSLIRHAYVRTTSQQRGVGGKLLTHLLALTGDPVLIGTWADASWAIRFYEMRGFTVVSTAEKERLLRLYWKIPERQVATSVVLVDRRWRNAGAGV